MNTLSCNVNVISFDHKIAELSERNQTWSPWCSLSHTDLLSVFPHIPSGCVFFFHVSLLAVVQMSSWIAAPWRTSPLLPSVLWQPQKTGPWVSIHQWKLLNLELLLLEYQFVYNLFLLFFVTFGPFHFSLCRVPFWRFLITGADQNQELKMWCTVSWTCLQTIRLLSFFQVLLRVSVGSWFSEN